MDSKKSINQFRIKKMIRHLIMYETIVFVFSNLLITFQVTYPFFRIHITFLTFMKKILFEKKNSQRIFKT